MSMKFLSLSSLRMEVQLVSHRIPHPISDLHLVAGFGQEIHVSGSGSGQSGSGLANIPGIKHYKEIQN